MTKADIVNALFENVGLPKKEAEEIIEIILETMKQTFADGDSIKISGFGSFNVRSKRPRRGRNPKTGEDIEITSRKVITFKPSSFLKATVE
ncbi:integration host factor subunit alpha [Candidatus Magnetobacterium casense]|uniref:integration host factor subunit alpha n=1 Tax=Candidatus Magnetobacterium casense TaxID=1455061 RepID=UPI00058B9AA8|nr:integration host factor subunit alpha [Candidatus Magnetobacterium casensis]